MIRGQKRTIKTPDTLNVQASIHNRFDIEVVDAATGKVKQTAQALNVICDGLWTRLFAPAAYFSYIFYGGGTGTPSSSDTSLFSHIGYAAVANMTYGMDYSTGVYYRKGSIQLSAATAAGKTISEVGIGYGTSSSNLCTHAMLKDMNGNPISIEKTDTDVINIYATIFVHFERLGYDNNTIFLVEGEGQTAYGSMDLFTWFSGAYSNRPTLACWVPGDSMYYKQYRGDVLAPRDGAQVPISYSSDVSAKRVTLTLGRLESSTGNYDQGLMHVCLGAPNSSNLYFYNASMLVFPGGASYPYSIVEGEAVATGDGVTQDFALDFAFPHDARVYVDGVETTDFTLDYAPNSTNWVKYMKGIDPASREGELVVVTQRSDYMYGSGPSGKTRFYNPMWEIGISHIGLSTMKTSNTSIFASNDNVNWEKITPADGSSTTTVYIPTEHIHKKFWRVETVSGNAASFSLYPPASFTGKCLHLATPPAEGAVITADYKCDCFAKDANHVLDMSVTIQFNEYTEAQ